MPGLERLDCNPQLKLALICQLEIYRSPLNLSLPRHTLDLQTERH